MVALLYLLGTFFPALESSRQRDARDVNSAQGSAASEPMATTPATPDSGGVPAWDNTTHAEAGPRPTRPLSPEPPSPDMVGARARLVCGFLYHFWAALKATISQIPMEYTLRPLSSAGTGFELHEAYVHGMLEQHGSFGLACWEPRSFKPVEFSPHGIIPGDVGTYTTENGFVKGFNLWDDMHIIREIAQTIHPNYRSWDLVQDPCPRAGRIAKGQLLQHRAPWESTE